LLRVYRDSLVSLALQENPANLDLQANPVNPVKLALQARMAKGFLFHTEKRART
jgi:hypothetical protein